LHHAALDVGGLSGQLLLQICLQELVPELLPGRTSVLIRARREARRYGPEPDLASLRKGRKGRRNLTERRALVL